MTASIWSPGINFQYTAIPLTAVGDGVTDDTLAFQTAIDEAEAITYNVPGGGRPQIVVPPGNFLVGTLTISKRLKIVGTGSGSTFIQLKSGVTTPLFVINAENVAATSIDDANHCMLQDLTLLGNRTDSVTTNSSHGVSCPTTAWSIATQYSTALRMKDVCIYNFSGDGIFFGDNRNWPLIEGVIVRYCNGNGLSTYGYDGRYVSCDFGVCTNVGVREYAGGANAYTGCNIYYNDINVVVNNTSNAFSTFTECSIDYAYKQGVSISQATADKKFIACRFYGNSRAGANLYSDFLVSGDTASVTVMGCSFTFAIQKVKYLIETAASPDIIFIANEYDHTGADVPWQTAISNTPWFLGGDQGPYANVIDYGAIGDGTTDDTAAFAAAVASRKTVILPIPATAFIVGDLALIDGTTIMAEAGGLYSSFLTTPVVRRKAGCTRVFNASGAKNIRLAGFTIDGVARDCTGLGGDGTTGHIVLDNVDFRNLDNALGDTNYIRTVKASQCVFYGNNYGIRNPIDSIFLGGFVSANLTQGISCGTGADANTFVGVKVEWNVGNGYRFATSIRNNIVGGVVDRNYKCGVMIDGDSGYISITGVTFTRNGRNDTTAEWAHIRIQDTADHITITGCTTKTGADDGGGGPTTPQYCVDIATNTVSDVTIAGNDLTGCTVAAGGLRLGATIGNLRVNGNNGVQDVKNILRITASAGTTALDATIDQVVVEGSTTHTLTLPPCARGREFNLINSATGTVTVNRAGADTINGGAGGLSVVAGNMARLVADTTTNWVGKAF